MKYLVKINRFFATGFGVGELNIIPGTMGSLLALILYVLFPAVVTNPGFIFLMIILGVVSANLEEQRTGIKDEPRIIIDEIAGMWLALILKPGLSMGQVLIAFALFRFFDIKKPGLINSSQKLAGGLGVMVDDILSGLVVAFLLRIFFLLS